MTTDPDDALRWEGDEGEAPVVPARKARPDAKPAADAAEGAAVAADDARDAAHTRPPAPAAETPDDTEDVEPAAIGNVALVFYGIIGGVYLLFAVGWIVGGFRLRPRASLLLVDWMYFPWMWLAAVAPILWFAAAWVLTRSCATWIRVASLIAGALLLVPWPFVMFGTVGS
ncbi:MAG: hypothetical protein JST33_04985 [Actinobacteria bacterium]|nr:hypothetical protein [Actinomycetota bacterium]